MKNEEWKEYKLGDIYEVHNGLSKGRDFFGSGFPFLSFSTIFNNWFIPQELDNLVQSTETEQESFSIKAGDVFVTRTSETADELGMSCVALKDYPKATYNGFCKRMRQYNKSIDVYPRYVGYYLRNPNFRKEFQAFAGSMSTRASLTNEALLGLKIKLPSLAKQKEIANILSALDDKIELNDAINRNLEEQAQALFKNWFIDFKPFGGAMPEDWESGKLGDVAEIKKKAFHPEKNPGLVVEHYSLPALDEKHYPVFEIADGIKSNKFVVSKESVLISKLNPDTKRIWRPYCISENPICSTEFVVFESINGSHRDFLYSIIDSKQFYDFMGSLVTGCTNSHQRVSPETLLTFPVAIPPKAILKSFCDKITPIYEMIEKNVLENQLLAHFRDTILPKLMAEDK